MIAVRRLAADVHVEFLLGVEVKEQVLPEVPDGLGPRLGGDVLRNDQLVRSQGHVYWK